VEDGARNARDRLHHPPTLVVAREEIRVRVRVGTGRARTSSLRPIIEPSLSLAAAAAAPVPSNALAAREGLPRAVILSIGC